MTHDVATIARSMETSVVKNYKKKDLSPTKLQSIALSLVDTNGTLLLSQLRRNKCKFPSN